MVSYEVERAEDSERGIRVVCPEHGEEAHVPPGRARVAFYCEGCAVELEVTIHDELDWRDWGERC